MATIEHARMFSQACLKPYPGNPRRHTQSQTRKLARLITRYGFTNPIVIDEDNVILAGHGRFAAAQFLGLDEIPAVRVLGLTEPEKVAFRIADNRIGDESVFDPELLSIELHHLLSVDFALEDTAFDAIELDPILNIGMAAAVPDEPAFPELELAATARPGDLWMLGNHKILCGDARDPTSYALLLGPDLADMVFADPPWNLKIDGFVSGKGRVKHQDFRLASGEMTDNEFCSFLDAVLRNIKTVMSDGSLAYVCIDWRGVHHLINVGASQFCKTMNIAVWAKSNAGMGSLYRSQHEFVVIFKNGTAPHVNNVQLGRLGRYRSNLWQYPGASGFSKSRKTDLADHPTVKPIELIADAIKDVTKPGDLVLDPFGGAGTTLLAAQQTKRRAALIEIEPKFVDVTLRRFQQTTGIEPLLLPDHVPLSLVRAQRLGKKEIVLAD